jgi:hypothetical protein
MHRRTAPKFWPMNNLSAPLCGEFDIPEIRILVFFLIERRSFLKRN